MLEMQQKFLDIARQNQLQDDRLKLARRQLMVSPVVSYTDKKTKKQN